MAQQKDLNEIQRIEISRLQHEVGTVEKEDENGDDKVIPFAKAYAVFNADQIEGLPADFYRKPEPTQDLGTEADPALDVFFAATGTAIHTTSQPRAFYDITADRIHMPPIGIFKDAAGYYGTLAHELTHWTGAASRLDAASRFQPCGTVQGGTSGP